MSYSESIAVNTTGSNGSASGSSTSTIQLSGLIHAIKLTYHASAPSSTVVTITEADGLKRTLLAITGNTSKTIYPVVAQSKNTDSTDAGTYTLIQLLQNLITVTVTVSNQLTACVTVELLTVN